MARSSQLADGDRYPLGGSARDGLVDCLLLSSRNRTSRNDQIKYATSDFSGIDRAGIQSSPSEIRDAVDIPVEPGHKLHRILVGAGGQINPFSQIIKGARPSSSAVAVKE